MRILFVPRREVRKANPEGLMPLVQHLRELRTRLLKALAAIAIGSMIGFLWYSYSVPGIATLGEILRGPYCSLPVDARATLTADGSCRLLATGPFDQFMLCIQVSFAVGVVLAAPIWLHQLWAFITPGLRSRERKLAVGFVVSGSVLFAVGAVLAYLVVAHALRFLLTIGSNAQITALSGSQYFDFIFQLLIIFGVSFEIPVLVVGLNLLGVLSYARLRAWRRGIIFGLFLFAAIVTPQDPFSMMALAGALTALFEIAVQCARINDRRRIRRDLAELSVLPEHLAMPIAGPEPIEMIPVAAQRIPVKRPER